MPRLQSGADGQTAVADLERSSELLRQHHDPIQARTAVSNAGNGNHTISSALGFGISVYGYGQYTSYWYPGGTNLTKLHE